jgi:sulfite exporter TauE/SafE
MYAILALVLYGFGWGLRRGASVCMALCVPAILPRLTESGGSWKSGLRAALLYNAPRMFALTALGAGIGAVGFVAGEVVGPLGLGNGLWHAASYVVVGTLMVVYGAYTFARATDSLEDLAEGKCAESPSHPIISKLGFASPKTDSGLLLWGSIVSLACLGETAIALEGALAGYAGGAEAATVWGGAAIGAATFLAFAIGAATPTLAIGAAGPSLLGGDAGLRRLAMLRQAAAGLMVAVGLVFLVTSAFR